MRDLFWLAVATERKSADCIGNTLLQVCGVMECFEELCHDKTGRDGIDPHAERPELAVVMISGHGTIATAMEATKLGAFDFMEKPLERERVLLVARNALERRSLAEENRKTLSFNQVRVLQSDWCQALEADAIANGGFDLIASNPPYIEDDDPHLSQGDVCFEPLSALTSGADGLDDIRVITQQAKNCLKSGGWLIFEHGYNQGEAVRNILTTAGYLSAQTGQDMAGVDRISFARLP